ncbi:MAG TPA: ThuA domain-containing protein [Vicinamibacterales bacterium]|nr:ThuA domain-containing protein [Vicinamibacterales bacterium]
MRKAIALCGGAMLAMTISGTAQQPAPQAGQPQGGRGGGGGRGGAVATALFTVADGNKDGAVSRDELKGTFDKWYTAADTANAGSVTAAQLATAVTAALPAAPPPPPAQGEPCGGRSSNPQVPCAADVEKMKAALPAKAFAKSAKPHKILVLGHASGFVHSSIPLAAATVDEMGKKLGTWTTVTTYNSADINTENLKQYDLVFLDSTTGCFLDDPTDKAATDARRAALLDFIRSGKGLAGIHAASDSYHGSSCGPAGPPAGAAPAGGGGGRGGGAGATLSGAIFADGDTNKDEKLTRAEMTTVADTWFDKLDPQKTGTVAQADFGTRLAGVLPAPQFGRGRGNAAAGNNAAPPQPGGQPLWPEWNKVIGGYFKFHWNDPQEIVYKIDDPKSPLTQMLKPGFIVKDETYTFNQESFSRENVHVLTSIDYSKMSDEDKAKESNQRSDHDYALSWIRREGKGRLFYMAHGHHERNYAVTPLLEHLLAGIQYALGDLKADDSPSVKPGTKTAAAK